jgi:hypothetical protein
MSVRVFNPATNLWSIYWVTNEGGGIDAASGWLEPPVVGRFDGDEGVFEGDDQFEGRPIRVRFRWTCQGPDAEQAFSADPNLGGQLGDGVQARDDGQVGTHRIATDSSHPVRQVGRETHQRCLPIPEVPSVRSARA